MGYKPGPIFSKILHAVEDAQLEGQLRTKEEAKEYVRREFVMRKRKMVKRPSL
jgi:hypothetical protein